MLFQRLLLNWFDHAGRKDLPWQKNISPYRVWVSEIMLQQTQVQTVIPYFERFIKRFPTVKVLAKASLDEVLHLWMGLGYYARARNLHKTAFLITQKLQSEFPSEVETLQSLPGIGRSTAGAILALGFKKRAPILDGNVKRVLARANGIEGPINQPKTIEKLWDLAERYTPKKRVADYTQAMMDLGSLVCTRTHPQCNECPFCKKCIAHKAHRENELPVKSVTKKIPVRRTLMLVLIDDCGRILLEKRPVHGLWGGLWCLPLCESRKNIRAFCAKHFGLKIQSQKTLKSFRHTFTHFHWDMTPILIRVKWLDAPKKSKKICWYDRKKPAEIGLPQPVKKLLFYHS
jgi:A/G-specific adenine glycosylase